MPRDRRLPRRSRATPSTTPSIPVAAAACSPATRTPSGRDPRRGSASTSSPPAGCARAARPDLAAPGERRAVQIGDDAVVLVRGDDGALRAFFNVCRHRGHELHAVRRDGEAGRDPLPVPRLDLRARRHAARDTALRRTAELRPRPTTASSPVRVEEWHGWVMVNVSGDAPPLARVDRRLRGARRAVRLPELVVGASHEYMAAANWKLPVENYHECYHCPVIHPELCRVSPPTSGDNFDLPGAWFGGTMDLDRRGDDVDVGQERRAFLPRPRRASSGARSSTSGCSRTCC